jgi:hypothetical protein
MIPHVIKNVTTRKRIRAGAGILFEEGEIVRLGIATAPEIGCFWTCITLCGRLYVDVNQARSGWLLHTTAACAPGLGTMNLIRRKTI